MLFHDSAAAWRPWHGGLSRGDPGGGTGHSVGSSDLQSQGATASSGDESGAKPGQAMMERRHEPAAISGAPEQAFCRASSPQAGRSVKRVDTPDRKEGCTSYGVGGRGRSHFRERFIGDEHFIAEPISIPNSFEKLPGECHACLSDTDHVLHECSNARESIYGDAVFLPLWGMESDPVMALRKVRERTKPVPGTGGTRVIDAVGP